MFVMKKIRKRLLTLFLGTSCTIMASCSGDKSKTNKSNGALGNKDPETTPTGTPTGGQSTGDKPSGTTTGDLPGATPNNPQKGGLPNTPGTSGKSGGGTTGGNHNPGGKGQQPQPFVLSPNVKEAIEKIKTEFPGFDIPADPQQKKQKIVGHLNIEGLGNDKKIKANEISTFIDLKNGSSFCAIRKDVTMVDYQCDGYMNAGNTGIGKGGGLADAFNSKFGDEMNKKVRTENGAKDMQYGDCKVVKIDWMNDHTKDKDLFYAVGVQGAMTDRLVELKENLFYITIDYLRNKDLKGGAHLNMDQIKGILGNNFDGFEKQVNCNYQTIKLASDSASKTGKTAENPYYLGMNPISTSIWGFNKNAAAYINLAIMYYLTSIKNECKNLCINMWCYKNGEDTPYITAINELNKK